MTRNGLSPRCLAAGGTLQRGGGRGKRHANQGAMRSNRIRAAIVIARVRRAGLAQAKQKS